VKQHQHIITFVALLFVCASVVLSTTITTKADDARALSEEERVAAVDELTNVITDAIRAWVSNDFDRYYANYAEDAVILGTNYGKQSVAEAKAALIEFGLSIVGYSVDGPEYIRLSADGMSAVVHYPNFSAVYKDSDGVEYTDDYAETNIWWKIEGTWKMVHVHYHELNGTE